MEQGTITAGDKLYVMPNRVPVEVVNVWLDQDEVAYLVGGENARVKLKARARAEEASPHSRASSATKPHPRPPQRRTSPTRTSCRDSY